MADKHPRPKPAQPHSDVGSQAGLPPVNPTTNDGPGTTPKKNSGEFSWKIVWAVFLGISAFVVAAGLFHKGANWMDEQIDKKVEKKLLDPTVLRKFAEYSRPTLILNGKCSIVQDMGAVQFINPDDIQVTERLKFDNSDSPAKIRIRFIKPVSAPPIMTSLTETAAITAERGKGLDWEFNIGWIVAPMGTNDADKVFRLEIFP